MKAYREDNILSVVDWFISKLVPVNSLISLLVEKILPNEKARAICEPPGSTITGTACTTHCGGFWGQYGYVCRYWEVVYFKKDGNPGYCTDPCDQGCTYVVDQPYNCPAFYPG